MSSGKGGDDYVIDEKRGKAWANPYDALRWYRAELDRVEAELKRLETEQELRIIGGDNV